MDALADISSIALNAKPPRPDLRKQAEEFVAMTFYSQLLKQMRNSSLKGEYMHGGRGEEIFAARLDMELVRRIGQSGRVPLVDTIVKHLSRPTAAGEGTELRRELQTSFAIDMTQRMQP